MFSKINITGIFKDHFKTLRNANSNRIKYGDIFLFVLIPLLVSGLLSYFDIHFTKDAINIVIAILAILVGLFFNVIVIIFDIVKRDSNNKLKNKLLKELHTNITYVITLSIIIILFSVLFYIDLHLLKSITSFIIFLLLSNFFLTVLMILKRVYKLFDYDIQQAIKKD